LGLYVILCDMRGWHGANSTEDEAAKNKSFQDYSSDREYPRVPASYGKLVLKSLPFIEIIFMFVLCPKLITG
jgi:hypothetical protein